MNSNPTLQFPLHDRTNWLRSDTEKKINALRQCQNVLSVLQGGNSLDVTRTHSASWSLEQWPVKTFRCCRGPPNPPSTRVWWMNRTPKTCQREISFPIFYKILRTPWDQQRLGDHSENYSLEIPLHGSFWSFHWSIMCLLAPDFSSVGRMQLWV